MICNAFWIFLDDESWWVLMDAEVDRWNGTKWFTSVQPWLGLCCSSQRWSPLLQQSAPSPWETETVRETQRERTPERNWKNRKSERTCALAPRQRLCGTGDLPSNWGCKGWGQAFWCKLSYWSIGKDMVITCQSAVCGAETYMPAALGWLSKVNIQWFINVSCKQLLPQNESASPMPCWEKMYVPVMGSLAGKQFWCHICPSWNMPLDPLGCLSCSSLPPSFWLLLAKTRVWHDLVDSCDGKVLEITSKHCGTLWNIVFIVICIPFLLTAVQAAFAATIKARELSEASEAFEKRANQVTGSEHESMRGASIPGTCHALPCHSHVSRERFLLDPCRHVTTCAFIAEFSGSTSPSCPTRHTGKLVKFGKH